MMRSATGLVPLVICVLVAAGGCGKVGYELCADEQCCFPGTLTGGECTYECLSDGDCALESSCEAGFCAAPTKRITCDDANQNPDNSVDVIELVTVSGLPDGDFEATPLCSWRCMSDFAEDGGQCVQEKLVLCSDNLPRFTVPVLEMVGVQYSDATGWTQPAACPYDCAPGFVLDADSGECLCDGACTTTNLAITAGTEDAMEEPTGAMLTAFSWITFNLDVTTNGPHWGGMRFELPIPQGATIVTAKLDVYVDSSVEDDPGDEWYVEAADDAAPFYPTAGNISGRTRSAEVMTWTDDNLGQGWHTSPSLALPLQEVVDRPGFTQDNHIVIITREVREAYFEWRQWDHSSGAYAPRLIVEWIPPS